MKMLIIIDEFWYLLSSVRIGQAELFAMVNDEWSPPDNPVLVLSCIPTSDSMRLSCINVVRNLALQKLTRPWQVCVKIVCVKFIIRDVLCMCESH